jgi:hypothetical protein
MPLPDDLPTRDDLYRVDAAWNHDWPRLSDREVAGVLRLLPLVERARRIKTVPERRRHVIIDLLKQRGISIEATEHDAMSDEIMRYLSEIGIPAQEIHWFGIEHPQGNQLTHGFPHYAWYTVGKDHLGITYQLMLVFSRDVSGEERAFTGYVCRKIGARHGLSQRDQGDVATDGV